MTLLADTPVIEPLPPYSPRTTRDPETSSIRSAAPSYNEPPSYEQISRSDTVIRSSPPTTLIPTSRRQSAPSPGLPRLSYAPGFVPRPENPFVQQNYAVSWSTVHRNPARRQYENVARRRAQQANVLDALASTIVSITTPDASNDTLDDLQPIPHEDPALVGPEAAQRNRAQRLYFEMLKRDAAGARDEESRAWDFVLAQNVEMRDAQVRWNEFRVNRMMASAQQAHQQANAGAGIEPKARRSSFWRGLSRG